jgi:ABC-type dipeptide/oligopeptide/nickel transport system permease component
MVRFILRRILIAIPTLILVSMFVFGLQNCCRATRSLPWRARNATPR